MASIGLTSEAHGDRPVVVTGGAGYIGSLLVRQLLQRGARVRVLDCLLYGDGAIRDLLDHPRCEVMVGDVRDDIAVGAALEGAQAVIHLAAIVGDTACDIDQEHTISTNTRATELIAEQCQRYGIPRMIFASTCSVYGASDQPLNEMSELNPLSLYATSKLEAERAILKKQSDQFAPVALRFGTAYGASSRFRFDLVINLLTAKAVRDGRITIHGGDQWRPFIHAHDIARAVQLALDASEALVSGQIFNVGADSQNFRLAEIGKIVHEIVPHSTIVTDGGNRDKRNYYVGFSKARTLLGFRPTRSVPDGVRELAAALAQDDIVDYHDSRFHNALALRDRADLLRQSGPQAVLSGGVIRLAEPAYASVQADHRQAG